jgi:hypothetical protein
MSNDDQNATFLAEKPPAPCAIGFIARELVRIADRLRESGLLKGEYDQLYAAQQALAWTLEPNGFRAPYDAITADTQGDIKGCSLGADQLRS